jgi:hypothetical protein
MKDEIYWTMKNGQKIKVDDMDINHLRNTLKMIIRNSSQPKVKHKFELNGDIAQMSIDQEIDDEIFELGAEDELYDLYA